PEIDPLQNRLRPCPGDRKLHEPAPVALSTVRAFDADTEFAAVTSGVKATAFEIEIADHFLAVENPEIPSPLRRPHGSRPLLRKFGVPGITRLWRNRIERMKVRRTVS